MADETLKTKTRDKKLAIVANDVWSRLEAVAEKNGKDLKVLLGARYGDLKHGCCELSIKPLADLAWVLGVRTDLLVNFLSGECDISGEPIVPEEPDSPPQVELKDTAEQTTPARKPEPMPDLSKGGHDTPAPRKTELKPNVKNVSASHVLFPKTAPLFNKAHLSVQARERPIRLPPHKKGQGVKILREPDRFLEFERLPPDKRVVILALHLLLEKHKRGTKTKLGDALSLGPGISSFLDGRLTLTPERLRGIETFFGKGVWCETLLKAEAEYDSIIEGLKTKVAQRGE